MGGLLTLPNFANPVQFICGGTFDVGASPDNYKRAEICRQRMGPVFKRITMNFPPMLFHPINSITAYKGQIIYDTPETEAKAQTPVPYLQWQSRARGDAAAAIGRHGPQLADRSAAPEAAPVSRLTSASHAGARPRTRPHRRHRRTEAVPRRSALPLSEAGHVRRALAISSAAALLAGCQFGGLNSLEHAGHARATAPARTRSPSNCPTWRRCRRTRR